MSPTSRFIFLAAVGSGIALCGLGLQDLAWSQGRPENKCRDLWEAVGLPGHDDDSVRIKVVCHLGYIVGHNDRNKTPDWVIEKLTRRLTRPGGASREGEDFQADPALQEKSRAEPRDYKESGFDQGHQAPAADFQGSQKFLEDTFFLSNSVPQVGIGFNRSIWRSLETHVRKLIGAGRPELYVITGPIYQPTRTIKIRSNAEACGTEIEIPVLDQKSICPENREDKDARCPAGVAIPAALYKIVYDPRGQQAFAVLLLNESHTGQYPKGRTFDYIKKHRVAIGTIEDLTGLEFFAALPERKQRQLRTSCVDVKFH